MACASSSGLPGANGYKRRTTQTQIQAKEEHKTRFAFELQNPPGIVPLYQRHSSISLHFGCSINSKIYANHLHYVAEAAAEGVIEKYL